MKLRAAWLRPVVLAALGVPLGAWMFYQAQHTFRADWASMAARAQVVHWLTHVDAAPAAAWDSAHAALQHALSLTPDSPDLQERLGDLYSVAGRRDWLDEALRVRHFKTASGYYQAAIKLRPNSPNAWAALAVSQQAMGSSTDDVQLAWRKARALGPHEGHVQQLLLLVALADWDQARPDMRSWVEKLFDDGDDNTRRQINHLAKAYGLRFEPDASKR